MLKPIRTDRLYTLIMEEIEKLINEENLKPGDRLPSERQIADSLSVSRTSVRQAITALAERGLLEIHPGSGAYITNKEEKEKIVSELSKSLASQQINPIHITEARQYLECEIAKLCALNASPECCENLKQLLDRRRISENRATSYAEMNRDLHLAIAEGTGNPVFVLLMQDLLGLMKGNMWHFAKERSSSRLEILNLHLDQHEAIVSAICAHDGDAAERIMKEHLQDIDNEMCVVIG